jgi:hypothetical protein
MQETVPAWEPHGCGSRRAWEGGGEWGRGEGGGEGGGAVGSSHTGSTCISVRATPTMANACDELLRGRPHSCTPSASSCRVRGRGHKHTAPTQVRATIAHWRPADRRPARDDNASRRRPDRPPTTRQLARWAVTMGPRRAGVAMVMEITEIQPWPCKAARPHSSFCSRHTPSRACGQHVRHRQDEQQVRRRTTAVGWWRVVEG